ncbi:MAG: signal recognition particle-docking protein FtsY [Methylotenera sp.]|nr:signal recognition particle-docking protein FtsY [Methylotenera sp.]MDO9234032.1 signal recognition particle-docking protein FtsY [Methylotenera sp.]MDO9389991.1 signal recognition particle-docking protein FtsY [Methylotenera sp.]MDP2101791.1 signal recognition particle-docking protein FtsY [Methylotenera sp.]MDP2281423.1 signal recognition particle-docking protein FtsY [Methylotenera sp.]
MFDFFKKAKTPPNTEANQPLPTEAETSKSWAERLKQGLAKTRNQLGSQLSGLFGGGKIDAEVYEELETILLTSDVGVSATQHLLDDIKSRVKRQSLDDTVQLKAALKDALSDLLLPLQEPLETSTNKPFVIMLAGVNGAGKTTTIGKLANHFQSQGKSVLIAAGDTFRAAAREQLQIWGERNNVHVVASEGGDAAAVMFDAINSARAKNIDIVLADTAGRLPTQMHLMDEIAKVKRVMDKALPGAPHEVLLVLDANTGQNAVTQVKIFDDALGVTGLVLSKLDGTAKGGVIAAIAQARPIPIRYIGIGEAIDDLRPFNANEFIDAMLD